MKKIIILTPALPESLKGNGITALRYKGIFETLGYDVVISTDFVDQPFDIVLAIHAVKSYESFRRYHDTYPGIKKILVLGGTDIYESRFRDGNRFKSSVDIADVVVGLERNVSTNFGTQDASKLKIITQSVDGIEISNTPPTRNFLNLIMTGHIRPGKNHFFVVEVTKNLPVEIQKRIKITHVGRALSEEAEKQAEEYSASCDFYDWLGLVERKEVLRLLAEGDCFIQPSYFDSASSAVIEAVVMGRPILASGIDGVLGVLGNDYDGYFDPYDSVSLEKILLKILDDDSFLVDLRSQVLKRRGLFTIEKETRAWEDLFTDLLR